MWIRRIARHLFILLLTVLLGGFLGATLVRLAPGFDVDEQELDARLSEESLQAIRKSRHAENNVLRFYGRYLAGLSQGDLGVSRSLRRPVAQLLAERISSTVKFVAIGLVVGWVLGLGLALPAAMSRGWGYDLFSTLFSGIFFCLPSGVLAFLFLFIGGPGPLAIGFVVFPKIFRYARNVLLQTYGLPHVLTAQAKGLGRTRILLWHVFPSAAPQILALAGVSVSVAIGAAIPIEVICGSAGIGQLAWQAALGRDLPLLVNLTLLVTVATLLANTASDLAIATSARHQQ